MTLQLQLGEIIDYGFLKLFIERVIGKGAFATVYLGKSISTGEYYAIKVISIDGLSEIELESRRREAFLMNKAYQGVKGNEESLGGNQYVIRYFGMYETSHHIHLILEYIEMDLFDALTQSPILSKSIRIHLISQLLSCVAHLHSIGMKHRDIKPENCLLMTHHHHRHHHNGHHSGEDHPLPILKLCDFGLATMNDESQEYLCGSIRYMSPEAYDETRSSKTYNTALNDVWSCGVVMINILFSRNPWARPTLEDEGFLTFINEGIYFLLNEYPITKEAAKVIANCFKSENERWSMNELVEAAKHVVHWFETDLDDEDNESIDEIEKTYCTDDYDDENIYKEDAKTQLCFKSNGQDEISSSKLKSNQVPYYDENEWNCNTIWKNEQFAIEGF